MMIGVDTNVLVRYLAQDDEAQAAAATEFVESLSEDEPGYVCLVVLVEVFWVLRRSYRMEIDALTRVLNAVVDAKEIVVEQADTVRRALRATGRGADFADALISRRCADAGCEHTVTFDVGAAERSGMQLLASPAR